MYNDVINYKSSGDGSLQPIFRGVLEGLSPELISKLSESGLFKTPDTIKANGIKPINDTLSNTANTIKKDRELERRIGEIGSQSGKDNLSTLQKFNNSKVGKVVNNDSITGVANSALKLANNVFHSNRTGLQKTDEGALKIRDAQYSVLKKIPVTAPFAKAAELLDNTLGAITGGLGSATKADKILTAIPLMGNTAAIFAGKTDTFKGDIQDINTGDFGGTVADSTRAQDISGVKSVAKKKLNNQIRSAQNDFNTAANIIDYNKLRLNNNIGQDLQSAILSKYQGNQQIMLSKNGSKFPELDAVRAILESSKVKTFKSGGKIEKENIIPTGALHKNLHHIDDIGIDITKKGIPVVTMDEVGEFKEQIAEVEAAEWTLSLDVTKQIEEYWENYKESGDDNIAIECGKYLVDQIFNNTRDDDKVIKKTE